MDRPTLSPPHTQVFVNIPRLSLLEWHPFSLTTPPNSKADSITIRELGDYTSRLREYASNKSNEMYIRVDGPYGHLPFDPRTTPVAVYFAGGIGITPIIGILRHVYLSSKRSQHKAWDSVLYEVGNDQLSPKGGSFSEPPSPAPPTNPLWPMFGAKEAANPKRNRIYVVWTVQNEVCGFATGFASSS